MPLDIAFLDDEVKRRLTETIMGMIREDMTREHRADNETSINQLKNIEYLLKNPSEYKSNGLTNHVIADILTRHGIISDNQRHAIKGTAGSHPKLTPSS